MNKHRIYGEKAVIKADNIKKFYNERAKRIREMECEYTAVLLGDQNPDHAHSWNQFEKEIILPQLCITKENRILDIGCGMGRWAETVIPLCGYYCGTDFSREMIEVCRKRIYFPEKEYDFAHASFQEIQNDEKIQFKRFDRIIIGGVCMYINEQDLIKAYEGLMPFLDEHCIMYFTETVAIKDRLTLNEFYSDALKTEYDVIYRTPKEYNEYYEIFTGNGFRIRAQDYLPHHNNEKQYSETERWYTIMER